MFLLENLVSSAMVKFFSILFFISSILFSQTVDNQNIKELMLNSEYSKVVYILEEKEAAGTNLTKDELFNMAIAYQRLANNSKALRILSSLIKNNSDDVRLLFALAETYRALGNQKAAFGIYKSVADKDSSNRIARIEMGKLSLQLKNYKEAADIYESLILQDTTNAYLLREYGFSLYRLGKTDEAKLYLQKALNKNKYDAIAALWLAKIYFDDEEYDKAKSIVKESNKYNPTDLQLNKLYAEILFKTKQYNSAVTQFYNLIILGDSTSVVYQKLGLSLYSSVATRDSISEKEKEEKLWEAITAFEKSIKKEKYENPLTLTYLGFCFKALKEYEESILFLERALNAMTPEYIDKVYANLGASYELTDNYYKAIINYNKSLKYSPKNPDRIFRLATLYDRYYADKRVALAHYKKYLKLVGNSENESVQYAKDRIEKLKEYIHFNGDR